MTDSTAADMELLRQIGRSPGCLSWYHLDRALSSVGLRPAKGVRVLMRKLEADGLIRSIAGSHPGQPRYELTDAGKAKVADDAA